MTKSLLIGWMLGLMFLIPYSQAQVTTERTARSYTLRSAEGGRARTLSLWRDTDTSAFSTMNYSSFPGGRLDEEIPFIRALWQRAKDSIAITLRSMSVGYPVEYDDVLQRHVKAILSRGIQRAEPKRIREVMLEASVYSPLDSLLAENGYHIRGFSTEKHGYVTKAHLRRIGCSGRERIPLPFIVWIIVQSET